MTQRFFDLETTDLTLVGLLQVQAQHQPHHIAYTFLLDGEKQKVFLTYQELDRQARAIAAWLQDAGAAGARALLLYPPGLEYIAAFFGCLYAGVTAVPAYPPRLNRPALRVRAIVADSQPKFALTTTSVLENIERRFEHMPDLRALRWLNTEQLPSGLHTAWQASDMPPGTLASLQYTSGSTGRPKGVMLSHGNLMHNLAVISHGFQIERLKEEYAGGQGVSWLPMYHDMGLIGGILQPLYVGRTSTLMSPVSFLQRPIRWLQAISRFSGTISGAPNFAYQLCVNKIDPEQCAGLDLSKWRVAFCGAEPIQPETLRRFAQKFAPYGFREDVFYPCYGLAEGTLIVTGGIGAARPTVLPAERSALEEGRLVILPGNNDEDSPTAVLADKKNHVALVGCGGALLGQKIVIADPTTHARCAENEVGEIWVAGPSVAQGYWNQLAQTATTFQAYLSDTGEGPFLRTGDLGLWHNQQLFVTGRLKDLIIIRGRNYYPWDIEYVVEQSHPALHPGYGAAFMAEIPGSDEEQLVIVQEIERRYRRNLDSDEVIDAIRQAVAYNFGLPVQAVVLIRTLSIPKTSSGKIQRHRCRTEFLENRLKVIDRWQASPLEQRPTRHPSPRTGAGSSNQRLSDIETWLVSHIAAQIKVDTSEIDIHQPFAYYGLDSVQVVQLVNDLETRLGRGLSPTMAYDYPTIAALARHLTSEDHVAADLVDAREAAPAKNTDREAIAVIGIGCRFPGGVRTPSSFWQLLVEGIETVSEVPADRWDIDAFYDPDPNRAGKMVTRWGSFLENIDHFDAAFFGISPREAVHMDPQQRLLLEVAWEALEDAGQTRENLAGTQTGVFIGISNYDYATVNYANEAQIDAYVNAGSALSVAAGRLSYLLDLQGPSVAIDTACSSSLVTTHMACQSLRQRECDLTLVGGVNIMLSPLVTVSLSKAGLMAPDGHCKAFDAGANGYVRGEGCGVVVLKRLSDALADGDQIYAVIRGSAINQDGRSAGMTAPNRHAQQAVIRQALYNANVTPDQVTYVEAHGTGTPLGDPIEMNGLAQVYSRATDEFLPCAIGSVKTNIGHTEATAGISGLIKTILALHHQTIPPHLHFTKLNPNISLAETGFIIPTAPRPWPVGQGPRYAGVSSFGFSGTNAHIILAEAPAPTEREMPGSTAQASWHLLPLSAHHLRALHALTQAYRTLPAEMDGRFSLSDLCYTASVRRSHHNHRLALVIDSPETLQEYLHAFAQGTLHAGIISGRRIINRRLKVAFVFCGQGPQWWGMGRQLMAEESVFYETVATCDSLFRRHASWSLLEELQADEENSRLHETEIAQPAIFALQVALVALWQSWGVVPDAVVGHSLGEIAAAYVAGVLSLEDACRIIFHRGRLMQRAGGLGKMAVVALPLAQVARWLVGYEDRLCVAAVNSPNMVTLSGDGAALNEMLDALAKEEVYTRLLPVDYAFHSPQMETIADELVEVLADVRPRQAALPLYSTVTGTTGNSQELGPAYWGQNVRQPVLLATAVASMRAEAYDFFLEIGPHPVLSGALSQCLATPNQESIILPSLDRKKPERATMLQSLGVLYTQGYTVTWLGLYPNGSQLVQLPPYPWQHERFWPDMAPKGPRRRPVRLDKASSSLHPLLGRRLNNLAHLPQSYFWETLLSDQLAPFLKEHILYGEVIVPITVYMELALAAAKEVFNARYCALKEISFEKILFLPERASYMMQVVVSSTGVGEATFHIYSCPTTDETHPPGGSVQSGRPPREQTSGKLFAEEWVCHATGTIYYQQHAFAETEAHPLAPNRPPRNQTTQRLSSQEIIDFGLMFFASSEDALSSHNKYRLVIEAARFADEQGFSAVWVPERHFTAFGSLYPNPAVLHAALARETKRVRLRAGSMVAPLHHPVRIAEEWAMVDNLSGGRIELSFASGWHPNDFIFFPERYQRRHTEMLHSIETVKKLWGGESLPFRNGRDQSIKIRTFPTPVQREVPIWITAASNPKTFAKAGELGANLLTHLLDQEIAEVAEKIALYRQTRAEYGHDPDAGRVSIMLHTFLGADIDLVREQVRKPYTDYLKSIGSLLQGLAHSRGQEVDVSTLTEQEKDEFANFLFERFYSQRALLGTPESCLHLVDTLQAIGVNEIACLLDFGPKTSLVLQNLPHLNRLKNMSGPATTTRHFTLPKKEQFTNIQARCRQEIGGEEFYQLLSQHGLQDGPSFQAIEHVWRRDGEALGQVCFPDDPEIENYLIYPPFLSTCFQILLATLPLSTFIGQEEMLYVPIRLDDFKLHGQFKNQKGGAWSHARLQNRELNRHAGLVEGNIYIRNDEGALLAEATGVTLKRLDRVAPPTLEQEVRNHLLYKLQWQLQPGTKTNNIQAGTVGCWLIFADEGGVGQAFASLLEERGQTCHLITPGDAYRVTAAARQINPGNLEHMQRLIEAISQEEMPPLRGVVHLWSLDIVATEGIETAVLKDSQTLATISALHLIQALMNSDQDALPQVWLVTQNTQVIDDNPVPPAIAQAPLWGFGRVIAAELPQLWGGLIDLDWKCTPAAAATQILETTWQPDDEDQVAFRAGQRYVARLQRNPLLDEEPLTAVFQPDATYLITGGLGGLGLEIAQWLAARNVGHLLLLGRSKLPPRDAWDQIEPGSRLAHPIKTIQKLERAGVRVHLAAVDIADEAQLSTFLKAFQTAGNPPIRGVIHAAAVVQGGTLLNLDKAAIMNVLRPKMWGGWLLHRYFADTPLDFFVVFSAIPSLLGWLGQGAANYAAANAFLNALAHYRRAQGYPTLNIIWGPWSRVGMAARAEGALERLEYLGVGHIPPRQGIETLEQLLTLKPTQTAAVSINWPQFFKAQPAAVSSPFLSEMFQESKATRNPAERQAQDDIEGLSRADLLQAAPEQRLQLLESYFLEQLAQVLAIPGTQLDTDQPLNSLGLDSLMAIQLKNRIQMNLGVSVSLVSFLQGLTLPQLASQVLEAVVTSAEEMPPEPEKQDVTVKEAEELLDKLDQLSDEEVNALLDSMLAGEMPDE